MKITRIDFEGFGALTNRTVDFDADKLNLVVEANEFGKSTMVEATWAILYGLNEKDSFKPWKEGASFSASMDLEIGEKKLRIIRDFDKESVQVLDLNFGLRDVTPQYLGNENEDQVGLKLLGMNRDTFRNTCLVGQRHLEINHMTDSSAVAAEIQGIADSSSPDTKVSAALQTISQTLSRFMHGNRLCHINELLRELEGQRSDLMKRMRSMDAERGQCREWFSEIQAIDEKLSTGADAPMQEEIVEEEVEVEEDKSESAEATALREELKLIESAIQKLRNQEEKKQALIDAASLNTKDSPITQEQMDFLLRLWEKEEAIVNDINLLHEYMEPHQCEIAARENEVMDRYSDYKGLDQFTNSEAQTISTYAVNLFNLVKQMDEMKAKNPEFATLTNNGAGTGEYESAKAKLNEFAGLSPEEVEEAKSYASLLVAFRDQAADTARKLSETKGKSTELTSDRNKARIFNVARVAGLLVAAVIMLAAPSILSAMKVALPQPVVAGSLIIGLLTMLISFFFLGRVLNTSYFKQDEHDSLGQEVQKLEIALSKGEEKVANLENKIGALANRCGMPDKKQFIAKLQQQSAPASQKETDEEQLRQLYLTKQQNCKRLQSDLAYFFNKAGMATVEIEPQSAIALSENINDFRKDVAELQERRASLYDHEERMRQMEEDLSLTEANIIEFLEQNQMSCQGSFELAKNHVASLIDFFENRNSPHPELAVIDAGYGDESARHTTQQELIERHIAATTRLEAHLAKAGDSVKTKVQKVRVTPTVELMPAKEVEELRHKKEDLTVKIRTTLKSRDELYLDTLEELNRVDHEIVISKRAKLALELAYEMLKQSSHETYADWSVQLNKISTELLQQLGGEIEMLEFSKDLHLKVKLRNHQNIFDSKDIITKLSTGTKEQIHWMARLIISRFLSSLEPLPIFLDEPFSEADDARFLGIMSFLIDSILPNNQVVIFSCHQQRHQWLKQQLEAEQQEKLAFKH
ncbi:MAG: AAA family ATPase [Candidatus Melainabacteria bacterium]|nr:AAA family ATPase [Candidatus Melainabacteria bacterium]